MSTKVSAPMAKTPSEHSDLIYTGPLAKPARHLKLFSLSSLVLTCALTPIMFIVDSTLGLGPRGVMAIIAVGTSALSTSFITWLFAPYTNRIYLPKTETKEKTVASDIDIDVITPDTRLTFETSSLTARRLSTTVPVFALEPSARVFSTWKVKQEHLNDVFTVNEKTGRRIMAQKLFYVHNELCEKGVMRQIKKIVGVFK